VKQSKKSARPVRPARGRASGPFPAGFLWGVATSAYQVEGAVHEDGRGPSIWDRFAETPGRVSDGDSGAVACDHYHRYREDVALMRRLGLNAYRFSVAWPRILPQGTGAVNARGLDFYDRLVDELLHAGIVPFCTLYHWDLPQALHDRGGWLNRDIAGWFAEYARLVARRLADRVKLWATLNEPSVFVVHGCENGRHAPGERRPKNEVLLLAHNAMRAHAAAVQVLRADTPDGRVGYVLPVQPGCPAGDSPEDVEAARRATFQVEPGELWAPSWWIDPVLEGRYPEDGLAIHRAEMPAGWEADLGSMRQPIDFLGLNLYCGWLWRAGPGGDPEHVAFPSGYPRSSLEWQRIVPSSMYWGPRLCHERTGLPILVTENGVGTRDWISLDGGVHDPSRVDYLHRSLLELARARRDGVPVEGYFHWSLLDNFEWEEGFKQRCGLVYVDYATQRRIPKDSFQFYRRVIASHGRALLGRTALPAGRVVDLVPRG
jgi:beta-glucosidase